MTDKEYHSFVKYAEYWLTKRHFKIISDVISPEDIVHDALLLQYEKPEVDMHKLIGRVLADQQRKHIKSQPKLYRALLLYNKEWLKDARQKLPNWYISDLLKQSGIEPTDCELEEKRRQILLLRNGNAKKDIILGKPLPMLPNGLVLLTTIKGFECYFGYAVSSKGELYSCWGRSKVSLSHTWYKKTVKSNGSYSVKVGDKEKSLARSKLRVISLTFPTTAP